MSWSIGGKKKKAASEALEEGKTTPKASAKTKSKTPPSAKGKGAKLTPEEEAATRAVSSANRAGKKKDTWVEEIERGADLDLENGQTTKTEAKPAPKERPSVWTRPEREEDGIRGGPLQSQEDASARFLERAKRALAEGRITLDGGGVIDATPSNMVGVFGDRVAALAMATQAGAGSKPVDATPRGSGKAERKNQKKKGEREEERKEERPMGRDGVEDPLGSRPVGTDGVKEGLGTPLPTTEQNQAVSQQEGPQNVENTSNAMSSGNGLVSVSTTMERRRPLPLLKVLNTNEAVEQAKVDALPKLACSTCMIGPECPEYKEGYVCAYDDSFKAFPSRDIDSVGAIMREVVDTTKQRYRMALLSERLVSGGEALPNTTRLGEVLFSQVRALAELNEESQKVTVTVEGRREDVVGSSHGGAREPGILSRLFGGGAPQVAPSPPMTSGGEPSFHMGDGTRADDTRGREAVITVEAEVAGGGEPRGQVEGQSEQEGLVALTQTKNEDPTGA